MRRKWLLCGILCGVVSLSVFGQNVGASNYDKQIKETEKTAERMGKQGG